MKFISDISFVPEHEHICLDIVLPDGDGPWPVVVFIHGGGWSGGDKEWFRPYGAMLAPYGIASVISNYRLSGEAPHPAQYDDVRAALRWVTEHGSEYEIDPSRTGVFGSSAGAHLASLVVIKGTADGDLPCPVRCVFNLAGPSDLIRRAKEKELRGDMEGMKLLIGGEFSEKQDLLRELSPLNHVHSAVPPFLAVHGDADDVVPMHHSELLVDALHREGCDVGMKILPGHGHGALKATEEGDRPVVPEDMLTSFFTRHLLP